MKKISMFLSLALLFVFVGCGREEEQVATEPTTEIYESKFVDISYDDCEYILNKNTGKFHNKYCYIIKSMLEENKVYCNDERSSIIEHGYVPCLKCNP